MAVKNPQVKDRTIAIANMSLFVVMPGKPVEGDKTQGEYSKDYEAITCGSTQGALY